MPAEGRVGAPLHFPFLLEPPAPPTPWQPHGLVAILLSPAPVALKGKLVASDQHIPEL